MLKDWPPLLRYLRESQKYEVRPRPSVLGFELYTIDLSGWKLRLSDRTPVVWVKAPSLAELSPQHLAESMQDVIRQLSIRRDPLLVLLDGSSDMLVRHTVGLLQRIVFLGASEQESIRLSSRPSGALRDLITAQIPISMLAPYETAAPVTGSRFFGREYELNRILGNPETNHIILGIRRVGKTSLLKEVERQLRENEPAQDGATSASELTSHIVYLDCSDFTSQDEFTLAVVRKLYPNEIRRLHLQNYSFFFPHFLERMERMHKRRIVFLLDEIDNLIMLERGAWKLIPMLRASSNKGICQFIMAGYREAMDEQHNVQSPFYNFAQEIRLNQFSHSQAEELIVKPMENLGVRFKSMDAVVSRIYEETAGHPNLIQYYCTVVLRELDETGKREFNLDNLIDVYSDETFKDHLVSSFMQNTGNREKALVYALLVGSDRKILSGFGQGNIHGNLRKHRINLSQNQIEGACKVLKLAGVFHQRGQDYFFTSPVFSRVLQENYDLDYLLRKALEEGIECQQH